MSRHTVHVILSKAGYDVIALHHATPALELIREDSTQFDLFIIDFDMDDIHGIELGKLIRQEAKYAEAPMILHTGCNLPKIKMAAMKAGFSGLFIKGEYDRKEFVEKVGELLEAAHIKKGAA